MVVCDRYGRPTLNLRISVTQRCNLRCPYCHREGEAHPSIEMTAGEIVRITRTAAALGITGVKLTGGEPLLRADILQIVEGIAGLPGVRDLSMTTNGALLAQQAEALHRAGLDRVNVGLPTLRPGAFRRLTGGSLEDVVGGVKAAVKAGLRPVKLNMVVLRGFNEAEVPELVRFAEESGAILQLIELEPVNLEEAYYSRYYCPLEGLESGFKERAVEVRARRDMQNRRVYTLPEGKVEVIRPTENTEFCAHCTRLRLTSDGKLKPCLMRGDNLVDILTPLRAGADDKTLISLFTEAIERREPYYRAAGD